MVASSRTVPIPVTVITGFLGSGKSTLVQRWLEELPRGETAVIVNERGDVGVDGELLAAHVARLREITGGCVCCKSQLELMSALRELSESTPAPARILVETSGAASPAGVVRGITAPLVRERLRLEGVVTVVDVTRLESTLDFDIAVEQLGFADVVVLSHFDRVDSLESGVDPGTLESRLARYAPAAVITKGRRGNVDRRLLELLEARTPTLTLPPGGAGHSAIEAASFVTAEQLDEERFTDWVETALADVEARILRVKGILAIRGVDNRVIVQGVAGSVEVELGRPWNDDERSSRLVVLGLGLDAAELEAGFLRCVAR